MRFSPKRLIAASRSRLHASERVRGPEHVRAFAALLVLLTLLVCGASWSSAAADESAPYTYPEITQQDIEHAARSGNPGNGTVSENIEGQITDPEAAAELPHSDLDRAQALELLTGVFRVALDSSAGPYSELHVDKFLSNRAAVIAPGEQPSYGGLSIGQDAEGPGPTLLQSSIPLRTENAVGEEEVVDLNLGHSEGELQPANSLADVGIPETLGEGIRLGGGEDALGISFVTPSEERAPSTVDGTVAVYPNVETDTDLAVAPTPEGVETLTQLRSPKSPTIETFRLELPRGAKLEAGEEGGAEVRRSDGKPLVKILPPSAIDAEGAEVPVSMSVSEDSLTLRVSTNDSTTFPVLVDPMYQTYQWYELSTAQGTGDFVVESNEPSLLTGTYWSAAMPNPGTYLNSPGLYVQAHANTAVGAGASAAWSYYVPRLKSDEATYHDPPHTYISGMHLHDLGFFTEKEVNGAKYSDGGSNPHLWSGIWDGVNSTWPSSYFHDGPEGQITNFAATFDFYSTDQNGKIAEPVALSTYAWRWMGENWREAYAGYVGIEVSEEANKRNPTWGSTAGPGWVNATATKPVEATAEDLGLGIKSIKVEGTGAGTVASSPSCSGLASAPCPRKYKASIYGYEPAKMPQGIDYVSVTAEDVLGNRSAEPTPIPIKVDHTAPTLSVSGSATEQATRGTGLEVYSVTVNGTDGSSGAPQSGVVKSVIKVDGKTVNEYSPGCGTNSCALSREWQLEANTYAAGKHTLEVSVTDGVGLTTTKLITLELHPDHLPPIVALSGTMTEQAGVGTTLPRYALKVSATDPTEGNGESAYSLSFGSSGAGSGQFSHPADIAIDAKGNLWVADQNNNRLQVFNANGGFIKAIGSAGSGNGQFSGPKAIAFAANGNFWVADSANNRLQEFSENGGFIKAVGSAGLSNGQLSGPESIAIDGKGNLWVSDTYNYRIQEFNEKGEFIKIVNPSGLGAIEPTGIAAFGGNIWVTDWAHNRVVQLSEAGQLVRQFGTAGAGNGQFKQPDAVAVDLSGNIWIGDQNNERVQEFNQQGEYVAQFGSSGTGAGQFAFSYPMGIAVDAKGNIWVTDTNNNRIEKWTQSAPASSGIASVSIKVDGTIVSSTAPGCPLGGCSLSREWTLVSSNYGVGSHTVEATAVDAAGHKTTQTSNINIARDQTAPQLSATGALVNAPDGWVEEKIYPYSASATDIGGYGLTNLVFKIDGATIASAPQSCLNGSCADTLSGTLNAASYAAGSHSAELLATDGAGNTVRRAWTMNVNPEGIVTSEEATDTLEALEQSSEAAPVAPNEELLEPEQMEGGDNPSLHLEGGAFVSTGVPDKTEVLVGVRSEFVIKGPDGDLGIELQGASEPNPTKVAEEVAAVAPSDRPGVDTVIRPEYNGALAFEEIREPTSPEQFVWKVHLSPEQTLVAVDSHNAEVKWENGPRAYLITAELAHDATGKELETSLNVQQPNLITLTVRHRVAGVVYPVLAGQGFQTSYHPAIVTGPLTEPEGGEGAAPPPPASGVFTEAEAKSIIASKAVGDEIVPAPEPSASGEATTSTVPEKVVKPFKRCSTLGCGVWWIEMKNPSYHYKKNGNGRLTAYWQSGTQLHSEAWYPAYYWPELDAESCGNGFTGASQVWAGEQKHLTIWARFEITATAFTHEGDIFDFTNREAMQIWVWPNGYQQRVSQHWEVTQEWIESGGKCVL